MINVIFSRHGVRIHSILAAAVPLALILWPDLPVEAILTLAAAVLGVGLGAAKHEDTKTLQALYKESPWPTELRDEPVKPQGDTSWG